MIVDGKPVLSPYVCWDGPCENAATQKVSFPNGLHAYRCDLHAYNPETWYAKDGEVEYV